MLCNCLTNGFVYEIYVLYVLNTWGPPTACGEKFYAYLNVYINFVKGGKLVSFTFSTCKVLVCLYFFYDCHGIIQPYERLLNGIVVILWLRQIYVWLWGCEGERKGFPFQPVMVTKYGSWQYVHVIYKIHTIYNHTLHHKKVIVTTIFHFNIKIY